MNIRPDHRAKRFVGVFFYHKKKALADKIKAKSNEEANYKTKASDERILLPIAVKASNTSNSYYTRSATYLRCISKRHK